MRKYGKTVWQACPVLIRYSFCSVRAGKRHLLLQITPGVEGAISLGNVRWRSYISDPENKGRFQKGVNFDTLGSWNNRMSLPIHYEQSVKKGKIIPRVPMDEVGLSSVVGRRKDNEDRYAMDELGRELLYFGVFDGHGGSYTAEYASRHLTDHMSFWLTQTNNLMHVLKQSFSDMNNLLSRNLVFYHLAKTADRDQIENLRDDFFQDDSLPEELQNINGTIRGAVEGTFPMIQAINDLKLGLVAVATLLACIILTFIHSNPVTLKL